MMKRILQLEELAAAAAGIYLLNTLPFSFSWWVWVLLFLAPDVSIIGYAVNSRMGAFTYNLLHHKGIAILAALTGYYFGIGWLALAGVILFIHSSADRLMGYGLKYGDAFRHTHLSTGSDVTSMGSTTSRRLHPAPPPHPHGGTPVSHVQF